MSITIKKNNLLLDFKQFIFPAGEIGVKLAVIPKYVWEKADHQTVIAHVQNSADLMTVAMLKNALEEVDPTPINLFLPYVPYARQDRICDKGEAFSLKVFCNILNSLNFNKVIICDPHSEVTPALINNVKVISQFNLVEKYLDFVNRTRHCVFVSPDAGANKKTSILAGYYEHSNFVRADKLRNLSNGKIKETIVYTDDFKGKDVVVADDCCDGGRTFLELAKVCKQKNCGKFILYVTHGIFSQGAKILFENGIDEIWTTNSFRWTENPAEIPYYERIKVLNLEERFSEII